VERRAKLPLPEEWDFSSRNSGLPVNELEICSAYEYCREAIRLDAGLQEPVEVNPLYGHVWLKDVINRFRQDANLDGFDWGVALDLPYRLGVQLSVPLISPEWPDCPYLRIDPGVRQARAGGMEEILKVNSDHTGFLSQERPGGVNIPAMNVPDAMSDAFAAELFLEELRARRRQAGHSPLRQYRDRNDCGCSRDDLKALWPPEAGRGWPTMRPSRSPWPG